MDIDAVVGDVGSFDPELLQLPELSPFALKASPQIAEDLYAQWLSLPQTGRLVNCLLFLFMYNFCYQCAFLVLKAIACCSCLDKYRVSIVSFVL